MLTWATEPVTVRVPATSANLGPGFDSLGLALTLHDTVRAAVRPAGLDVRVTGAGAGEVGRGEGHLVVRAMRAAFTAVGGQPPGLELHCRNEVPQGFGLGSSAAAIVAGLLTARELAAEAGVAALGPDKLLQLATNLEGHPDNVAACLSGGLTISWVTATAVKLVRLTPLAGLAPILCLPSVPLATESARLVLPEDIPHAHAAANSARAALLVAGLTGRPELLLDATEDFLHQPYRAAVMPATAALIDQLRAAGVAAMVSGAGPAVLALTVNGSGPSAAEVERILAEAGPAWRVLPLSVDANGARVLPYDGLQQRG
ncbi:MAG TPA: homoserine kinase [Streptosporangiaceae bacterium]|nr:homoserine kinase [Streptosporangiaceae bacterium]